MKKEYNIGLDIGTESVGWAVVEAKAQKIIKKGKGSNRKSLWGVRLFEKASSAKDRRIQRGTRRLFDRRRERIRLLQEIFQNEINKVDPWFFQKLKESKYKARDVLNKHIIISQEENKLIKDYYKDNPTIYHLRNRLMTEDKKFDIRLVYLALHHIIKYRGNFLYDMQTFDIKNLHIEEKLKDIFDTINRLDNIEVTYIDDDLKLIKDKIMLPTKNDIREELKLPLKEIIGDSRYAIEFGKMIVGNKFDVAKLLLFEAEDKKLISFSETDYEDNYSKLETFCGDKIEILELYKELYDMVFLLKMFKGKPYDSLSLYNIDNYKTYQKDLAFLKEILRNDRTIYNIVFKSKKDICLYEEYVHNKKTYDEFITKIKKYLEDLFTNNIVLKDKYQNEYTIILKRMDNGEYMPKTNSTENSKYPYQLNENELIKIIENQGKYYPFLLEKVDDDYKINRLLKFRIPYYVGPLVSNKKSQFAWMVRNENMAKVKITPFNFAKVIDKEATAEKFILRMISHCTYLLNEEALPNNAILYQRFKVLNELKQIRINNDKLALDVQQKIIKELFEKTSGTITEAKFKKYINCCNDFAMYRDDINITGYSADKKFANNMQSYVDFFGPNGIFKNTNYNEEDAEKIIKWITIFEDKEILEEKIRREFKDLNEESIKRILLKKYTGWGRLSKKLLQELYILNKENEKKNIIDLMYETNENFMQIINNDKYKFQDLINENNPDLNKKKLNYDMVNILATSPQNKRGIFQTLKIIEDIIKFMGYEPKNIVFEMARGDAKKGRKDPRKSQIEKLYEKTMADDKRIINYAQLKKELSNQEDFTDKIYLYFLQEGKCLYSGEALNIEDLSNCEIDHILPRSIIKDDSLSNRALVLKKCNQEKSGSLIVPKEYRDRNINWWNHLVNVGLMTKKKFYLLTRKKYSDEDIEGFINRQLVETRQIIKHVKNIIENLYEKVNVVCLRADISSDYREKYELFKYRDLNDYHHAHDAYLAAVLGEYQETYFKVKFNYNSVTNINNKMRTLNNFNNLKYGLFINSLDNNVKNIMQNVVNNIIDSKTGEVLFDANEFNERVKNTLYRNDILITRKTQFETGEFYNETIATKGSSRLALKQNMPVDMYNGYSSIICAYNVIVKYKDQNKMIGIPIILDQLKNDKELKIKEYLKNQLNAKTIDDFEIIKDRIPYEILLNYNGQNVYIGGYGIAHKNFELCNAHQLKIKKDKLLKWKYILNYIFNNKNLPLIDNKPLINDEQFRNYLIEIINYLYDKSKEYPLYINIIMEIKEKLALEDYKNDELIKIIKEIVKIYRCSKITGTLKDFNYKDSLGRLPGKIIKSGIIINQSMTGLKEYRYEF